MGHAMAVGTQWNQVCLGVHRPGRLGKRSHMVDFNEPSRMGRAVPLVEAEPAGHATMPMELKRPGPVSRAAFVRHMHAYNAAAL